MSAEVVPLSRVPLLEDAATPMVGCVVLIPADRRADQLASLFARRADASQRKPEPLVA